MTNTPTALDDILKHFALSSHPEGGAYLETYRSLQNGVFEGFTDKKSASTGIFFLLKKDEFSSFHRIKSDEMWHFYLGGPLAIVEINPQGDISTTILGHNISFGEKLQYTVPAGNWFASYPLPGSLFSFVGCTVSPGFDFNDFELATRKELTKDFPQHDKVIKKLTR